MHGVPQMVSSSGHGSAVSAGVQCAVPVFEAAEARAAQAEARAIPVPSGGAAAPAGLAKAAFCARWSRATLQRKSSDLNRELQDIVDSALELSRATLQRRLPTILARLEGAEWTKTGPPDAMSRATFVP